MTKYLLVAFLVSLFGCAPVESEEDERLSSGKADGDSVPRRKLEVGRSHEVTIPGSSQAQFEYSFAVDAGRYYTLSVGIGVWDRQACVPPSFNTLLGSPRQVQEHLYKWTIRLWSPVDRFYRGRADEGDVLAVLLRGSGARCQTELVLRVDELPARPPSKGFVGVGTDFDRDGRMDDVWLSGPDGRSYPRPGAILTVADSPEYVFEIPVHERPISGLPGLEATIGIVPREGYQARVTSCAEPTDSEGTLYCDCFFVQVD